ncbi:MAG: GldG family protein [Nitrospiraceae bacterium]
MEMSRFAPVVGALGLLAAIAGLVLYTVVPHQTVVIGLCELIALGCAVAYLALRWKQISAYATRRSTKLGANSLVLTVLFVTVLGIVNFLGARHSQRWDLSETQTFSLAPQTHKVLRGLSQDVSVTVFAQERSQGFNIYRDLLESYRGASDRLKVTFIDPERQPDEARKRGISRLNTAVVESGTETVRVTTPSEAELTSAIIRITRGTKKKILFLEGHGEHSLNDRERNGYDGAKEALTKQGYDVAPLSLLQESRVPEQASVVVVAGPQRRVTAEEKTRLKDYVAKGGRLLVMLDPDTTTDMGDLLAAWGVSVGPGVLVDLQDRLAQGDLTTLLVRTFTEHEITQDLSAAALMPTTQHLTFKDEAAKDWEFVPLARTSPRSWAETDLQGQVVAYSAEKDIQGPLPIAAALTPKQKPAEGQPNPAVLIVGNSTFASNTYLNFAGNTDLFLHMIGWLAQERDLVSITPKEPAFRPFTPNPMQASALFWLQVILLPASVFFYGLTVWRRRRRL